MMRLTDWAPLVLAAALIMVAIALWTYDKNTGDCAWVILNERELKYELWSSDIDGKGTDGIIGEVPLKRCVSGERPAND